MTRMRWIAGAAAATAVVAGGLVLRSMLRDPAPPARDVALDAGVRPRVPPPPVPPGSAVPPLVQPPGSADRVMPYRPATYLRWSEGLPAIDPAEDDRSPILDRLLAVTRADATQQHALRTAWRVHEEGRRRLLAAARPPSIGEPQLDRAGLAELDDAFEIVVQSTLDTRQLDRLSLERPPPEPDEPEPEP